MVLSLLPNKEPQILYFFCSLYIEWNGDHQKLHSRLRDTILNREVPIETILEVNEMFLQLEEANNNDVVDDEEHEVCYLPPFNPPNFFLREN